MNSVRKFIPVRCDGVGDWSDQVMRNLGAIQVFDKPEQACLMAKLTSSPEKWAVIQVEIKPTEE